MIFIKQLNLSKKIFIFLALFNLCISFENCTYTTRKIMDTFVFSQAIPLKGQIYMFSIATLNSSTNIYRPYKNKRLISVLIVKTL